MFDYKCDVFIGTIYFKEELTFETYSCIGQFNPLT